MKVLFQKNGVSPSKYQYPSREILVNVGTTEQPPSSVIQEQYY